MTKTGMSNAEKVTFAKHALARKNPHPAELAAVKGFLTKAFEKRNLKEPVKGMRGLADLIINGILASGEYSFEKKLKLNVPERKQIDDMWTFLLPLQYAWTPYEISVTKVFIEEKKIKVTFSYKGDFQTKEEMQ